MNFSWILCDNGTVMPDFYLIVVVILFVLAVSDLIVGVSNDAVNFLNSSIGSRVASRKVIMIVASIGIFVGATFSSGMMEVARSGVFNPQFFTFSEVMVLFLAVMITDVILLDLFNTFGMPTSTTVSIVFELLGAAVMLAIIKLIATGDSLSSISEFINMGKAMRIITGIFLSIAVAFTTGAIVQYLSRLLFTFNYTNKKKIVGVLWASLALSSLTYFLLLKGVKGASFVSDDFITWVKSNTILLFAGSFVVWVGVMYLMTRLRINIFRIVVLFGTFSLAMAFAGNDLVNFIGVPIAGLESFVAWDGTGILPDSFNMAFLKQPVRTNSMLLLLAGTVMVLTLWFSKKAQSVTETEVNLSRQSDGQERFSPNGLAQGLVRGANHLSAISQRFIPASWAEKARISFMPPEKKDDKASFDLIRASVNLTTASILVAFATSLKLPLSTTYVSFMVAMGSSLADRAWGRESAVYRVAGVIRVISGWFATAAIAFTVAALFALLIFAFKLPAIGVLVVLAFTLIYRTFRYHKKKEKRKQIRENQAREDHVVSLMEVQTSTLSRIVELLKTAEESCSAAFRDLLTENRKSLITSKKKVKELSKQNKEFRGELIRSIQRVEDDNGKGSMLFIQVYDLEQDVIQSVNLIVDVCTKHIENGHHRINEFQQADLESISQNLKYHLAAIQNRFDANEPSETEIVEKQRELENLIRTAIENEVKSIKSTKYSKRNSQLMLDILLEVEDLLFVVTKLHKLLFTTGSRLEDSSAE